MIRRDIKLEIDTGRGGVREIVGDNMVEAQQTLTWKGWESACDTRNRQEEWFVDASSSEDGWSGESNDIAWESEICRRQHIEFGLAGMVVTRNQRCFLTGRRDGIERKVGIWKQRGEELVKSAELNSKYTQDPRRFLRRSPRRFPCRTWKAGATALARRPNEGNSNRNWILVPSSVSPSPGSKCSPASQPHSSIPTRTRGQAPLDGAVGTWHRCVQSPGLGQRRNPSHWQPPRLWGGESRSTLRNICPSMGQGRVASPGRWSCGRNRRSGG